MSSIKKTNKDNSLTEFSGEASEIESLKRALHEKELELRKEKERNLHDARIEQSLDRIRSMALSMQSSDDLMMVAGELRAQMIELGQRDLEVCAIHLYDEDENEYESWGAARLPGEKSPLIQRRALFPKSGVKIVDEMMQHYRAGDRDYVLIVEGEKAFEWFDVMRIRIPEAYEMVMKSFKDIQTDSLKAYWTLSDFKGGALLMVTYSQPQDESRILLRRMANVFELAYQRFKDLKNAEAQARVSQIEAALERVRSSALSMQDSKELEHAVKVVFENLQSLGIRNIHSVNININHPDTREFDLWLAAPGQDYTQNFKLGYYDHPITNEYFEALERGETLHRKIYSYEVKNDYFRYMFDYSDNRNLPQERKNIILDGPAFAVSAAICRHSSIFLHNYSGIPFSDEANAILLRFSKVFDQTYTRFLDLKKTEASAREAKIEACLERVRSSTISMHHSQDLQTVINVIKDQLIELKFDFDSVNFITEIRDNDYDMWLSSPHYDFPLLLNVQRLDYGASKRLNEAIKNGIEFYSYRLSKEDKDMFFQHLFANPAVTKLPEQLKKYVFDSPGWTSSVAILKKVIFSVQNFSCVPFSEEENTIIRRFASVFEQSYTRFLDLQAAEIHAVEAMKQASLDRIRAEVASMRDGADLERITPVIWKELHALHIPFFRCGIYIVNEPSRTIDLHLSTPDGKHLTSILLHFDETSGNVVENWRQQKAYVEEWDRDQFRNWVDTLFEKGKIQSAYSYYAGVPAVEKLVLHFIPFKQGMLYIGSSENLSAREIQLLESVADAFSVAYSRYEDFKTLEEAKNQIELTLSELRSAQTLLIQSEKMASLGEMTAGIAHEIQNPLNFVNNFSEVNKELLTELKTAIDNGQLEEAKLLADDIIANEVKINTHGNRADGIVKSMLQHSRTSSGQKELTDINALADEYLRLAFHGLRAKDKSFNAKFETDFDPGLGKINIVAQDLGRVILNLLNNAFYAVTERYKSGPGKDYSPAVKVSTKNAGNKITIAIKDNGMGIPQKNIDKIFQPFFTTKPSGKGTGLGLSLSYDIVRAHGGELDVQTKEGEGTVFTISLPA